MLNGKNIKIIGHRGAAGLVFENTIASILEAIKFGVDCIEIDVWKTTDNELIVFHDFYLERLTPKKGFIFEKDYKTIKSIKLNNGDSIPTSNEVIQIVKEHKVQLLVEVKAENALIKSFQLLKKELSSSDYIIGSFFHKGVMDLKKENREIQTSIMFESVPVFLEEYLKTVNPDYITVSIETINDYLSNTVRSQNKKLLFYTINNIPEIEIAVKASPFGIITNYPNLFVKNSPT